MVIAVVFALGLFVFVPVLGAGFLKQFVNDSSIAFVIIDGLIRIALIVGYIWLIGRSDDIQRVFQYHGAEHKTIHAYENGDPLDLDAIQRYSPRHPRCGTSFIVIVAMVAFFVFLLLAPLEFFWQVIPGSLLSGHRRDLVRGAQSRRRQAMARLGFAARHVDPVDHHQPARRPSGRGRGGIPARRPRSRSGRRDPFQGCGCAGALAVQFEEENGGGDG